MHKILTGRATFQDTLNYANRYPNMMYTQTMKSRLSLSKIGFGSFRAHLEAFNQANFKNTLKTCFNSGINLIDTSAHFGIERMASAEEMIGNVLQKEYLNRNEYCIVTKTGFLKASSRNPFDVEYLESEISKSLNRLRLETIDIYLINAPELYAATTGAGTGTGAETGARKRNIDNALLKAFGHLDLEVERGRIGSYGISSNHLHLSCTDGHIPLSQFVANAPKHENFSTVQYPFNLFENQACMSGFDGSKSLADQCADMGIFQMLQRPLMCITKGGIHKLGLYNVGQEEEVINNEATRCFQVLADLEGDLSIALGAETQEIDLIARFNISNMIAENLSRLVENLFSCQHYFKRDIQPCLDDDLKLLAEYMEKTNDAQLFGFLETWIPNYRAAVNDLLESVLNICKWHSDRTNLDLNNSMEPYLQPKSRKASLSTNAISFALSHPGPSSVLIGMDNPEQVSNNLKAMDKDYLLPKDELENLSIASSTWF